MSDVLERLKTAVADRYEIEESGSVSRPGLAMLLDQVEPGAAVLDVGSGPGFFAVPLQRAARAGGRVWCFEPDPALASVLVRNLVLNGLANSVRIVPGTGWPRLDAWVLEAGIEGVDVVRVRPFNHTGPGQSPHFVVPAFASQIARIEEGLQEPVMKVGNLEAARDFADVRDVVRGYHLAVMQGEPGEVYNLASGRAYPISELLETLAA